VRLERRAVKVACVVLRGLGGCEPTWLPGDDVTCTQDTGMAKKSVTLPCEADRHKIPVPIKHQLLMEAGYQCGNPKCPNVITLQIHHIQYTHIPPAEPEVCL